MSNQECRWVVGKYIGTQARSIALHADAGVGFHVLERDNGGVLVAFRYGGPWPLPAHLVEITDPIKIAKYESMRRSRTGLEPLERVSPLGLRTEI